jgi:RHS repeat-associated protein
VAGAGHPEAGQGVHGEAASARARTAPIGPGFGAPRERDAETGLDYFGARYYRADLGRFTTVDPVSITPERLLNPQRLNRYAYAINNPLRYVDPKGLDIITYDQQGQEIDRVKQSKWHNFWYGDTYNLSAGGATYNLEGPLKPLPNGSSYEVVSEQSTLGMIGGFVRANGATVSSGADLQTVLHNSPTGQAWDFKNLALTADQRRLMLFEWGGSLHRADYVGNMAWAYIMASNGYSETFAKMGAGAFQTYEAVLGRTGFGSVWSFGDDPRDAKAIAAGYQLWNRVLFGY